jgi:hypothetical protein
MEDVMEQERSKTYWLEDKPLTYHDDGVFELFVDGRRRATCTWHAHTCVLYNERGLRTEDFAVFYGEDFFSAAERRLGIGRVEEVRSRDGENLSYLREKKERESLAYTRRAPHARYAQGEMEAAARHLDQHLRRSLLPSAHARAARAHTAAALEILKSGSAERLPEACDRMRSAAKELVRGRFSLNNDARMWCERALGSLEHYAKQRGKSAMLVADFDQARHAQQPESAAPVVPTLDSASVSDGKGHDAAGDEGPAGFSDRLFQPSRSSHAAERERDEARGFDAEDPGREM